MQTLKLPNTAKAKIALDKVMLGLLYIENGNLRRGIIILDEFTSDEPDLLITPAVKHFIKENVKKLNGG